MTRSPSRANVSTMDDVFASATPPSVEEQAVTPLAEPLATPVAKKIDGRTLQATGRTHQFATRIKAETHQKMLEIVQREKAEGQHRFTLAELIELAVDAYERERASN